MGDKTRKAFYNHFAKKPRTDTLHTHLESIVASEEIPVFEIGEVQVSALPIQHASGANPHFYQMLKDAPLIRLIQCL
jgi:hypothetical protein